MNRHKKRAIISDSPLTGVSMEIEMLFFEVITKTLKAITKALKAIAKTSKVIAKTSKMSLFYAITDLYTIPIKKRHET